MLGVKAGFSSMLALVPNNHCHYSKEYSGVFKSHSRGSDIAWRR